MSGMIVYFHGYGSNANTDKVRILKEQFPDYRVVAFDADIDPDIAIEEVGNKILRALIDYPFAVGKLVFIGTSLGAWLASELSDQFDCDAVLINPASYPHETLSKYGVPDEITTKYSEISLNRLDKKTFFINPNDEVIDHSVIMSKVNYKVIGGTHQCAGEDFIRVLDDIKLDYEM